MLDFAIFYSNHIHGFLLSQGWEPADIVNRGSLHEFLVSLHQEFGSVASFWFGRRPVVSLGSVDQLQQHINPNRTTDSFETMLKSLLVTSGGRAGWKMEVIPGCSDTPLCAHLLGLAMKTVTQLVISFRKNKHR
uniref:Uncharacterized protein n=1 Tax=Seriola dumerili TaxID=41447 RepID=A0A3B4UFQ5_SERDU